jgi:hypothetical protein
MKMVEDFFYDEPGDDYKPLPKHSLEESPCYPIIDMEKKGVFYYCKVHPKIQSVYLESIEHHCKYKEPDIHRREILSRLSVRSHASKTAALVETTPGIQHPQQWYAEEDDDEEDDYRYYSYYYMT